MKYFVKSCQNLVKQIVNPECCSLLTLKESQWYTVMICHVQSCVSACKKISDTSQENPQTNNDVKCSVCNF